VTATRITPDLVESVRQAIDVVDVAGEFTRLKKQGKRYLGLCPFHREKTPSFSVDPDQGLYYCFGCGAGGDAFKLYMEQTGDDFPAAVEALARRYGIPLPAPREGGGQREERRGVAEALEAAAEYFQRQLEKSDFARRYLDRRKISADLRRRYGLGYAPDGWRNLLRALGRRIPVEALIDAGLVARSQKSRDPYDRFRHRLVFPIHSPSGRLVGFGGRTLGDDRAKYVNTSETEQFHKSRLLYGFHLVKRELRETGKALLVEGYFDVLGAAASGIDAPVAGMGTSLTAEQAKLLARYTDEVVIGYDGDDAGEKAFHRALPILLGAGLGVRRARFPDGHDPDSLRLEAGPEAVRRAVEEAEDGVALEIERLAPAAGERDPRVTSKAASAVAELLRPIRDGIVRHGYARRAAELLGIPAEMLQRRIRSGPGGAPAEAAGADAGGAPGRRREVWTMEEQTLHLLLTGAVPIPPLEQLPTPEVFFDRDCRNIYHAFYALYKDGEPKAPASSDVVTRLERDGGAVDRVARLLLETSVPDEGSGLQENLDHLLHRWRDQCQRDLKREIEQAEQQNDQARLTRLLEQKTTLSRSQHPAMTGRLW